MNAQCLLSGKQREEKRSLRGVRRGAAEDQWTIMMRPPCVLGLTTILKRLDAFSPERWQHVVLITVVLVKEVHAAKWGGMVGVVVFFVQSGFMIS
jgi:hypothetical protein